MVTTGVFVLLLRPGLLKGRESRLATLPTLVALQVQDFAVGHASYSAISHVVAPSHGAKRPCTRADAGHSVFRLLRRGLVPHLQGK